MARPTIRVKDLPSCATLLSVSVDERDQGCVILSAARAAGPFCPEDA